MTAKASSPTRSVGRDVIGRVEVELVDLRPGYEPLDVDRMVALELHRFQLVVLDGDVLALGDLVALDLVLGLDGIAAGFVDELAANAVSRGAIEGAEGDALGLSCWPGRALPRRRRAKL
jgi:hypothetical protein